MVDLNLGTQAAPPAETKPMTQPELVQLEQAEHKPKQENEENARREVEEKARREDEASAQREAASGFETKNSEKKSGFFGKVASLFKKDKG
jgi:hypothetical protein